MLKNYLKGVIDRFEEDKAVILINKEQILWPKNKLTADFKQGTAVKIFLENDLSQTEKQKNKVKKIWQKILENKNEKKEKNKNSI